MVVPRLHFSEAELAMRRQRAIAAMTEAALGGLLLFKQESRYYLTGYDSGAHTYFQCLYLGADGAMTLLCRLPDVRQAAFTSVIADVRYWADTVDARPGEVLLDILAEHGAHGARLGVETDCFGMTAEVWLALAAAADGVCDLVDTSHLIDRIRLAKSPAERGYIAQAATLADQVLRRAVEMAEPGVDTAAILAETQAMAHQRGGEAAASNWLIASGAEAGLLSYHTGRRVLGPDDVLQLRLSGVVRRYHAPVVRACAIGTVDAGDRRLRRSA